MPGAPDTATAAVAEGPVSAIDAVGLRLDLTDPRVARTGVRGAGVPATVRLADYPQLKRLAWQLHGVTELSPAEALSLYERNWRHLDQGSMAPAERALVQALVGTLGGGRLLV